MTAENSAHTRRGGSRTIAISRRMLQNYIRPYFGLIMLGILANMIVAGAAGSLPWFIQQAVDSVFAERNQTMLWLIPLGVAAVSVVRGIATFTSSVILNFVGQRITATVQAEIFSHLVHADMTAISETHSGNLIAIFLNDAKILANTVNNTLINLFRHLLTLLALTGMMFVMNWYLASIFVLIVIPAGVVLMRRLGKVTRRASHDGLTETGELSTLISETLVGLRVVKAYSRENRQIEHAKHIIERVLEFTMRSVRARSAASPIVEALAGLAIGGIIFWGGYQSIQGNLSTGEFMGFISALLMAYQPLRAVANLPVVLQEGVAAGLRVFTIIDRPSKITDKPDAAALVVDAGKIKFENVTFRYAGRDTQALQNINIDVQPGQTIALVGPSGAGKSTLLNLILRFHDVDAGSVEIDGQDIRDVTTESLRAATALVTQEPFLFDDTIAANIALGRPDASQAEIEKAAKSAAAHDFISRLPKGYETACGEGGMQLSGGQRQRIAIARAMLKDAPILLLDEATSALDTASEQQVQKALKRLMKGRTSLVIAHRLSTVIHADCIYLINQGQVAQAGTHAELCKTDGLYASLYQAQFNPDGEASADGKASADEDETGKL